jgi:predicted MFS family arabinose efflux permease
MTAHFIVPNFIPTHAKEVGISNENIGILIAVLAAVSLFSRIFVGIVVDRMWFSWSTAIALTSFVTGTACHLLRFVNDFPALLIFVVIVGKIIFSHYQA